MSIEQIDYDSKFRGRVMLALQKAIVAKFDKGDWHELGHMTDTYDYIVGHSRLLRSLSFGDEDYGGCVFHILDYLAQDGANNLITVIEHNKITPYLEKNSPDLLSEIGLSEENVPSVLPTISATDVVRKALADADSLLLSSGATSAIDRLHTALHGYLRSVCSEAEIPISDNAAITALFKTLRTQHHVFQNLGHQESEIHRILMSFASVVDALNTIRNHGSIAHPNESLLEAHEAELTVNAVRTLFNYLVKKIGS